MSLNWDVKENKNAFREISKEEYKSKSNKIPLFDCPRYEEESKYYEMNTECNILIFLCGLIVGIPEITEENYEMVYNRISILEEANGGTYLQRYNPETKQAESNPFTLEMVKNNIGIKTNGITMSKTDFQKKVIEIMIGNKSI
jgi:hypothetical protein